MLKKIGVLGICLLMMGCLSPINTTPKNNYVLNTVPPSNTVEYERSKVLLVSIPRMSAVMDNNNMVYLDGQHRIGYFSQNRWAAKPNAMLFSLLLTTLEQQGGFKAVVAAPYYGGKSDLRLDVVNFSVVQDFTVHPSLVAVKMDVQLSDMKTQTVLRTRSITVNVPAAQNTPAAGVVAANQAVADSLVQIVHFIHE